MNYLRLTGLFLLLVFTSFTLPCLSSTEPELLTARENDLIEIAKTHSFQKAQIFLLRNKASKNIVLTHLDWQKEDIPIIELFLQHGVDINAKTSANETLLSEAIFNGEIELSRFLVKNGAQFDYKDKNTLLMEFIEYPDYHDFAKLLIEKYQANINHQDKSGDTPLLYSVAHPEILQYLLNAGVELNAQDNGGASALLIAVADQAYKSIALLSSHGAKPDLQDKHGQSPLSIAKERQDHLALAIMQDSENLNRRIHWIYTPLTYAIKYNHYEFCQYLLEQRADSHYTETFSTSMKEGLSTLGIEATNHFIEEYFDDEGKPWLGQLHNEIHEELNSSMCGPGFLWEGDYLRYMKKYPKFNFKKSIQTPTALEVALQEENNGILELLIRHGTVKNMPRKLQAKTYLLALKKLKIPLAIKIDKSQFEKDLDWIFRGNKELRENWASQDPADYDAEGLFELLAQYRQISDKNGISLTEAKIIANVGFGSSCGSISYSKKEANHYIFEVHNQHAEGVAYYAYVNRKTGAFSYGDKSDENSLRVLGKDCHQIFEAKRKIFQERLEYEF